MSSYALLALLNLLALRTSGEYFDRFCMRPLQMAKGEFANKNSQCVVYFQFRTKEDDIARDLCESNAPYFVSDFKYGEKTKCVYDRPTVTCEDNEAGIEENCIVVKGYGTFDKYAAKCGDKYQPYHLTTETEKKWIVFFFKSRSDALWTRVEEDAFKIISMERRKPRGANESLEETEGNKALKIALRKTSTGDINRGDLVYADPKELHPYLCSRKASYRERGIENLISNAKNLGFTMLTAKDRNGKKRPFIIFENVFSVPIGSSKFDADYRDFDSICDVFPNGYVASHFDFQSDDEYRKVIKRGKWHLYRTKVARHTAASFEPKSCSGEKDSQLLDALKNKFNFITKKGAAAVPTKHWESSYPSNMCADTPRITAVMAVDGYRDFPAIARLPVICTFGNPPDLETRPDNEVCSKAAYFDESKGRCVCKERDMVQANPSKYGKMPLGMVCESCRSKWFKRSVIFLIDGSGSITDSQWQKEVDFIADTVKDLNGPRSAVVEIGCLSKILLDMGDHTGPEILRSIKSPQRYGTGIGGAFQIAKEILDEEYTDFKTVIILSDGEEGCPRDSYARQQFSIAREWRRNGVIVIYVAVGRSATDSDILDVAGSVDNVIPVDGSLSTLGKEVSRNVMKPMCGQVY